MERFGEVNFALSRICVPSISIIVTNIPERKPAKTKPKQATLTNKINFEMEEEKEMFETVNLDDKERTQNFNCSIIYSSKDVMTDCELFSSLSKSRPLLTFIYTGGGWFYFSCYGVNFTSCTFSFFPSSAKSSSLSLSSLLLTPLS